MGLLHELVTVRVRPPGWRLGHDRLVLDGGQSAERDLASAPVVGVFDPGDDRYAQVVAGAPRAMVEDVLLQREKNDSMAALSAAEAT